MSKKIKKKIEQLRELIREYDYLYYVLNRSAARNKNVGGETYG